MVQGAMCVTLGALIFGFVPSGYKYAMLHGVSPSGMTCYSFSVMAILGVLAALIRRKSLQVSPAQFIYLMLLGMIGIGGTTFLLACAITLIPVGIATMIQFMYPSVVTLVMAAIFHERLTNKKIFALMISIVGMALISDLGTGSISLKGILFALCASFTYAFYFISNERSIISDLPLLIKLTYSGFGCALLFGAFTVYNQELQFPNTKLSMAIMLLSCVGNMVAYYLIAAGIRFIGASRAAAIDMMEPVFSVIFSTLIYHDKLTVLMVCGIGLIFFSVLITTFGKKEA